MKDRSHWWSYGDLLVIVLLGGLLYLPGLGQTALFDRDEPRFATAARTMVQTGDYLIPRFNGELRPDKPPLFYWEMAGTYQLVGFNELGARLPSAICGTLTLLVVYFATGARFGRLTALVASAMLATTGLYIAESRLATADATMILWTTVALACAWRAWEAGTRGRGIVPRPETLLPATHPLENVGIPSGPMPFGLAVLFWVALGLGVLAKGVPLLLVMVPMAVLSIATAEVWGQWKRQSLAEQIYHFPEYLFRAIVRGNWGWWRGLRPAVGMLVFLMIVAGWLVPVLKREEGRQLIMGMYRQQADRVTSTGSVTTYKQPPGFYLAMVWVTFWPWIPLLIPAAYHTVKRLRGRTAIVIDARPYQFLAAWIVPMWIVFELIRSKLVHYVLPLYIPLVILCADALVQSWHRMTDVLAARWFQWARWGTLAIWLGLAVGVLVAPRIFVPAAEGRLLLWLAVPTAGALAATGIAGAIAWARPAWVLVTALGFAFALALANVTILPAVEELHMAQRVMAEARSWHDRGFVWGAGSFSDSLVFYSDEPALPHIGEGDEPMMRLIFSGGPKRPAKPGEHFGNPEVATVAVVDQAMLNKMHAADMKYRILSDDAWFEPGPTNALKGWWRNLLGAPPTEDTGQLRAFLVTNEYLLPASSRAGGTEPASAPPDTSAASQ